MGLLKTMITWGAALTFIATPSLFAADLSVTVKGNSGEVVDHAVVTLLPMSGVPQMPATESAAVMRQQNTTFQPFILPVRVGTSVSFPNLDEFRHHVYSFSKAKRLELRLYGKDESNEILFDKAGVVALGCNIHDNMLAYIYVTEDPYHALADSEGRAVFNSLAVGRYKMTVWHPDQKSKTNTYSQEIEILEDGNLSEVSIMMRSVRRRQKGPDGKEYN